MPVELLLPGRRVSAPPMPSYVKLAMAFGVGAGASLFDKSRYRSHGAITTATWAAGVHGFALDFVRGNPDYVVIPAAHTQLNFTSQDFSIVVRLMIDAPLAAQYVFNRGLWNQDGYALFISASGEIMAYTDQLLADQRTDSAAGDIVVATWYTVGMSRSGASIQLYKNGVDVTAVPAVHIDPANCTRTAKIGVYDDLVTQPFDGKMEFLRIFGGIALSTSEHLAWHNALA